MKSEKTRKNQHKNSKFKAPKTDPSGSWTGVPSDENDTPVQDADDL